MAAEVTNELIYEALKKVQNDVALLRSEVRGVREEITAMREHVGAIQRDITNIFDLRGTLEAGVDRIERRLELSEPAH